ncbi:hypothetical protein F4560_001719 [Saccharothrix ecbatanensis]|uniref:Uncharacterized protein n=1 Tax=Saccharothrix ecbatanensis TaxID=1105145 RepID=A0A7W9HHB4_9PSEU|nr:hypothetical protein [Saccharothrix ecbatanensis]MBB5801951.1 hypothetical protein [Saccharothrix ecbatanensis]
MGRTTSVGRARPGKPARRPEAPRSLWGSATALVTTFALGFAVAFVSGSWTSGPDATERRIAELKEAEARRDIDQVGTLIELAKGGRERLTPVLEAMAKASPLPDTAPPTAPTIDEVRGWREVVSAETQRYVDTPSAGNGVNVARTGMRTAVQQLAAAVDGFATAVTAPEPLARDLLTLAGAQRTLALRTWSVAALQLDVISVDAGKGHVHVYLPSGPDSGTIPADTAPEGSG